MNIQSIIGHSVSGSNKMPGDRATIPAIGDLTSTTLDVQFLPDTTMKNLLGELKQVLQVRSKVLEALPTSVRQAVQQLLQDGLGNEQISQGLVALSKAQKAVGDQVLLLISSLQDAIVLDQSLTSEQKSMLIKLFPSAQLPTGKPNIIENGSFQFPDILLNIELLGKATESELILLKDTINTIRQHSPVDAYKEVQTAPVASKLLFEIVPNVLVQQPSDMPKLPEVWSVVRLLSSLHWSNLPTEQLHQAVGSLQDLVASLQKLVSPDGISGPSHQLLSFTFPLYFANTSKPYPTYIHVYNQEQEQAGQQRAGKQETWIRICMETENVGMVDVTFRLYQENQVNLRVAFTATESANAFASYIPDLRSAFSNMPLNLREVAVGAAGDIING